MSRGKINIFRAALIIVLSISSIIFLMGDFCQDVLSIPIEVDYVTEDDNLIELTVNFADYVEPTVDGDSDYEYDGEYEIPDGDYEYDQDIEFTFKEEGYELSSYHLAVDFTEEEPTIKDYKSNLVGVFIRSIKYEIIENTIPATIPGIKIYLTQHMSPDEINIDNTAETFDWDAAVDNREVKNWAIPEVGEGAHGLVKLGETEPEIYEVPVKNFPSPEITLDRQEENIKIISDTILSNFQFEIVVVPADPVLLKEENVDLANSLDDLTGVIRLKLRLVVVVVVKP